jgi:hypothetical protein
VERKLTNQPAAKQNTSQKSHKNLANFGMMNNSRLYRKENRLKPAPPIHTSVRAKTTEAYFIHISMTAGSSLKHVNGGEDGWRVQLQWKLSSRDYPQ